MKKLLFSILMVLGLFILGCGKDGETGNILPIEDKSRPKFVIKEIDYTWSDGTVRKVNQINVIPADEKEEIELFKKVIRNENKEEFFKTFPYLSNSSEEMKERGFLAVYNAFKKNDERLFSYNSKYVNLENSYNEFIINSKELRNILEEETINKINNSFKNYDYGSTDVKVGAFNTYFIKQTFKDKI